MLQFKLDNEFELVFVAGYQKVLKLSYVDKFLDDMHREIRDRYKTPLMDKRTLLKGLNVEDEYHRILKAAEIWSFEMANQPKTMRTFDQSSKSKRTVASMIESRPGDNNDNKKKKKPKLPAAPRKTAVADVNENEDESSEEEIDVDDQDQVDDENFAPVAPASPTGGSMRATPKGPGGRRVVKNPLVESY